MSPPWELFNVKEAPTESIPTGVAEVPIVPRLSINPDEAPPPYWIALKPSESIIPLTPLFIVTPADSRFIPNCDLL